MHRAPEVDWTFMHAALRRIDARLQRAVALWQAAGQDPSDGFRGLYVSDGQAEALLDRPFGGSWAAVAEVDPDAALALDAAIDDADVAWAAAVDAARERPTLPRLLWLAEAFGLTPFEVDVLVIALAPALDLRYEQVYGFLQDDVTRRAASVNLVLDLLLGSGDLRWRGLSTLAGDGALFRHALLVRRGGDGGAEPDGLLRSLLRVDDTVAAWLLGRDAPARVLGAAAELWSPPLSTDDAMLVRPVAEDLARDAGDGAHVILVGRDHDRHRAAARAIAAGLGRPVLSLDCGTAAVAMPTLTEAVRLALRDARLFGAVLHLDRWDAATGDEGPSPALVRAICEHPTVVVLSARTAWEPAGTDRRRRFVHLDLDIPVADVRAGLWRHHLAGVPGGDAVDVDVLAGQFAFVAGQIRDAAATALDRAAARGEPVGDADVLAAARAHSNQRLGRMARKIAPRYAWRDIVLPGEQRAVLREIVAMVRGRPLVLDAWGVGAKLAPSRGVTVLFAGPSGTGKTMAAEIIAGELGLDLYKIDLSTVVSKYIGETEKNLERIFEEAATSNAILFFDEADALFGKRSEVRDSHDRYANIEISYLLQRMEAYEGVTILATNLRANVDDAFTRRLQFAIDFPFPDEAERLRIWEGLFPPGVPRAADVDLALLARRFKLAGGNIRNVLVSAAFLAAADGGAVTMTHLLHGTRRELQKMGRLIGDDDLLKPAV